MSAPSWAIFYKDDIEVNQCFVNCGWFEDFEWTLIQIIEFVDSNKFEFDNVVAYGRSFTSDLEKELKTQIESDLLIKQKFKDPQLKNVPVLVKMAKRKAKTLLAEEICGVQIMNSYYGKNIY